MIMEEKNKDYVKKLRSMDFDNVRMNRAYNMTIFRSLWKVKYGYYGDKNIDANKHNVKSLYGTLERSQESIRGILLGETTEEHNRIINWAIRINEKTGIAIEYLVGLEKIEINKELEENFEHYHSTRIDLIDLVDDLRQGVGNFGGVVPIQQQKLLEKFKYDRNSIEKYINGLSITIRNAFHSMVKDVEDSLKIMEDYEEEVDEAIRDFLKKDFDYNKKEKLYCLHFFMNKGRRFLGDKNLSIIELTNCMKIKNCNDIFAEGESAIYEYIIALREQLKLSEAVYLVNYNLRNFEDEKNFKNIFK